MALLDAGPDGNGSGNNSTDGDGAASRGAVLPTILAANRWSRRREPSGHERLRKNEGLGSERVSTTRTLGPLHFEDLEPHRFEDLVRQLIYEFRSWHSLEATGRAGADEGTDVRAIERETAPPPPTDTTDEESDALSDRVASDYVEREWRIQCKREKRIGPKRLQAVCDEVVGGDGQPPHGVIVAAACDFSKASRDAFRERMLSRGVEEFFLWGKGELEDLLFRPRNDHLLWAYFGVSLRVRRRSTKSRLASRLATKRALTRVLGGLRTYPDAHHVLLRDPDADEYPWPTNVEEFLRAPRWRYYEFEGHVAPDYLGFVTFDALAWLDQQSGEWDYIEGTDSSWVRHPELVGVTHPDQDSDQAARYYWMADVPESQQARLIELSIVHYDQVLAVDEEGDAYHEGPHLFVDFEARETPFRRSRLFLRQGSGFGRTETGVDELERRKFFPKKLPERTWEDVEAARTTNGDQPGS